MSEDRIDAYDFHLPPERIAQQPAASREASRLLFLNGDAPPRDHVFSDLPGLLHPGDLLVRNDTRVLPARLRGFRRGGGKAELLLMHPLARESSETPVTDDAPRWLCLARPSNALKPGRPVTFPGADARAVIVERRGGGKVVVEFQIPADDTFTAFLQRQGQVPLPPYIERSGDGPSEADRARYQTTYAKRDGAVAAPTAGLHFTPEIDAALADKGIELVSLTLHVGPGTFRPVIAEHLDDHEMDSEYYEISGETAQTITAARRAGRRIIAVGTTTTRVLETVTDDTGHTSPDTGWTDIFLRPGHRFRGIDGLITNFHLPRSTLLVLVSALAGRDRILAAYQHAIDHEYRFYSFGDAMLILPA